MTATPGIIMARFIEAAATESFLPSAKVGSGGGFWPAFLYDAEDMKGWDDQARTENASRWRGRATTGAITRHQECMDWTMRLIRDPVHRKIVWAFAFCKANDRDFSKQCRKEGWARPTAYRRLTTAIERIATQLQNEQGLLQLPDDKWMRHETPSVASISSTMGRRDDEPQAIQNHPFRTEKHSDLLQSEEAIAEFQKHLDKVNARRRKLQQWRNEGLEEVA